MADHWSFVLAAYGVTAVVLAVYWRHLIRRERELTALRPRRSSPSPATGAATQGSPS